jgi:putative endonuclease
VFNRLISKGEVMMKGYVYILASKRNGTLYTGSTNNLYGRVLAHREGKGGAFTAKYNVKMLVWFEEFELVTAAIQRETNIKRWKRVWKLALIEKDNPDWRDLFLEME